MQYDMSAIIMYNKSACLQFVMAVWHCGYAAI